MWYFDLDPDILLLGVIVCCIDGIIGALQGKGPVYIAQDLVLVLMLLGLRAYLRRH